MARKITIIVDVVDKASKKIAAIGKRMQTFARNFKFHYLSVLFFGMAIQRTFEGIARTGVGSFMKMTEGATESGRAILSLSAGFEYLKFTVGDAIGTALQPLLPMILDIINKITDWINQNQELFGNFVIAMILVGGFLAALGTLVLGIQGVVGAIGGFISFLGGPLTLALLAIIALSYVLYKAWTGNWFNIRQTVGTIIIGLSHVFWWFVEGIQIGIYLILQSWNNLLTGISWIANGIIDAINAVGGAWAWLTGTEFKKWEHIDLSPIMADIDKINKAIDEWQMGTGRWMYNLGVETRASGERMNVNQDITINLNDVGDVGTTFEQRKLGEDIGDKLATYGITGIKYK